MKELKCPHCGAPLHPKAGSRAVFCEYCGAKYLLEADERTEPTAEDGVVRDEHGGVFFHCRIPEGWSAKPFADNSALSMSYPNRVGFILDSPEGDGQILFRSGMSYRDFDPKRSIHKQNEVDMQVVCWRTYPGASGYCDEFFRSLQPEAQNVRVGSMKLSDSRLDELRAYERRMRESIAAASPGAVFHTEPISRVYNFNRGGMALRCVITAVINTVEYGTGGLFGFGKARDWECLYDYVLTAKADKFAEYLQDYRAVDGTVREGEYFLRQKQRAVEMIRGAKNQVAQTQLQMANDRARASQNISRILADKQNYVSNVQQSMFDSCSATQERVTNMQSEAIREVNTFSGNDGRTVEADTRFDRVFQHQTDHDRFVGTSGDFQSSDYDELKRRDKKE